MDKVARLPTPEGSLEKYRITAHGERLINGKIDQFSCKRIRTGLSWDVPLAGGLAIPSLTIIGAKPKSGKSVVLLHVAQSATENGDYCLLYDFENGMKRLYSRLLARVGNMNIDEWVERERSMRMRDAKFQDAVNVINFNHSRLFVKTERKMTQDDMERDIHHLRDVSRTDQREMLLIIDSLQKLWMENLSDRRSGIDAWLRFFEYVRNEYSIAILASSELKRPPVGGTAYKPTEISFKESGDIEYSADLAISLDRETAMDSWVDDPPENAPIKVTILFNRDGASGRLRKDILLVYPYHLIRELDAV